MVKIDVDLFAPIAAVQMEVNRPPVALRVLFVEFVDFVGTLLEALHLIKRDGIAHAGLVVVVIEELVVADAVVGILDDDVYFGATDQEVASQTQHDVVGKFVFAQLMSLISANGSRVGSTVAAHQVIASPLQLFAFNGVFRILRAEERFEKLFNNRWNHIFRFGHEHLLFAQFFFVELEE